MRMSFFFFYKKPSIFFFFLTSFVFVWQKREGWVTVSWIKLSRGTDSGAQTSCGSCPPSKA